MWDFVIQRRDEILFASWQHLAVVVPCLALATVLGLALAALVHRWPATRAWTDTFAGMGLAVPALAVLGVLIVLVGAGAVPVVLVVTFFAFLPVLRHALLGFRGIPATVADSARGIGMSRWRVLTTVELPLAWPVVLAGIRVSARVSMGVAALAAYRVGFGLGQPAFAAIAQRGSGDALRLAVVSVLGLVILAAVLDLLLVLLGRATTPRGLRV